MYCQSVERKRKACKEKGELDTLLVYISCQVRGSRYMYTTYNVWRELSDGEKCKDILRSAQQWWGERNSALSESIWQTGVRGMQQRSRWEDLKWKVKLDERAVGQRYKWNKGHTKDQLYGKKISQQGPAKCSEGNVGVSCQLDGRFSKWHRLMIMWGWPMNWWCHSWWVSTQGGRGR